MVQFNGTQCVNYQSIESAIEAHAEDMAEQFDKASGFEHLCRQLSGLVGDGCTPKSPHYKYNKSLQHQYAGLLDNAFKLDIEIVFCGNCGIWFGVQSDALETSPSWSTTEGRRQRIRCPDCGEGRAVDGLPEEPVEIESPETFTQQMEAIESIDGP